MVQDHNETSEAGDKLPSSRKRSAKPRLMLSLGDASEPILGGYKAPLVFRDLHFECIYFICADAGMGKSYVADALAGKAQEHGWDVFTYSFDAVGAELASTRVVRAARELLRRLEGSCALVVIDGVTGGDEHDVQREANALQRLVKKGCAVVVCLRPEAIQLSEEFRDKRLIGAGDLVFRSADTSPDAWEYTYGVPALVSAQWADRSFGVREHAGTKYLASLGDLMQKMLRPSLTDEEQAMRLAMMLLGHGTVDDLNLVAGRADAEMLGLLQAEAPFFGIELRTHAFRCAGISKDTVFSKVASSLQAQAALFPKLVVRACGVLASRGDVHRSTLVCTLCSSDVDFASVGVMWGVPYVFAGDGALVGEALRAAEALDMAKSAQARISAAAVASMTGDSTQVDEASQELERLNISSTTEHRHFQGATLLLACRDAWRNPQRAEACLGVSPSGAEGVSCLDHLRVFGLLVNGRFNEAYSLLSNEILLREVDSVPAALLCDDLRLALLMSGGVPDAHERTLFDASSRFFARVRIGRLVAYHAAVEEIPRVLMGQERLCRAVEEAVAFADRAGDTYVHAVLMTVLAVRDVRARALSRAHVRASRAAVMARQLGEEYLASAGELVDALAIELLGETGALGRYCTNERRPPEILLLGKLAARAMNELAAGDIELLLPMGTPCPRDTFWLLNMLINDCGGVSESIMAKMPTTWAELLHNAQLRQTTLFGPEEGDRQQGRSRDARTRSSLHAGEQTQIRVPYSSPAPIRISVLGGFLVEVDGEQLPESCFERRRAHDLVMLLAVAPGHKLRRYQAVEILWPEVDYYRGPRKLYEATSEARKGLGGLKGPNPLISDRSQGTLGFDPALVSCDIDEFEREARLALLEDEDDFWVLDHARSMERLYGTGPDSHLTVLGEPVRERLEELKNLYVDAALAAAEAALRLGKAKVAVRYASDAHRLRDLREDAMIALVQALRAAGRPFEVGPLYRSYCRHLLEAEGVPPSLALRRAVAQASGEGPDAPLV